MKTGRRPEVIAKGPSMAPPDKALLPTSVELELLSDEKVKAIVALADS